LKRFPYKQFEDEIDKWFRDPEPSKAVLRTAWSKLKGMAAVNAAVDYGLRPDSTKEQREIALSRAWEDVYIALKGYGDNILTGPILQLWHYVLKGDRDSLHQALSSACENVDRYYQQHGVRRRYLEKYWTADVKSDASQFQEPTALPIEGRPLRDWSCSEGYDYDTVQQVLHEIEIKEQARRVRSKAQGTNNSNTSRAGTVIQFPRGKKK